MIIILLAVYLVVILTAEAYADRVLIRKSDGYPIEYQTGDAPAGTLLKNNPKYTADQVDEMKITKAQYEDMVAEKITQPEKDKKDQRIVASKARLKTKLSLTDQDIKDLKEVLGD